MFPQLQSSLIYIMEAAGWEDEEEKA